ncbi:inositol monophosphatase family protein [Falsihalocynthiibacter sp. SS001]|uniref:inositol monophosphatase family protein n=1 Tax=Falsihalocynthiibacter sp. SS001 TaxID=3349698 RepID=UPI0036D2DF76
MDDLALLQDAAKASGEIAKKFWRLKPEVWDKPDGAGPVTEADLAIDTMLRTELLEARPDYGWLSEETEDTRERLDHEHVFIVDPIDGTRAFINGAPTFSHSLALAKNGKVTAAVVYLPMLDRLYCAALDTDATLNGTKILASARKETEGASTLTTKVNLADHLWHESVPELDVHLRSSLAYRLCLVAQGRFDLMLTLRDTWEWDVAAGCLIAERAGAIVTDQRGDAVNFNNARPLLHGLVAGPEGIQSDIILRLAPR